MVAHSIYNTRQPSVVPVPSVLLRQIHNLTYRYTEPAFKIIYYVVPYFAVPINVLKW